MDVLIPLVKAIIGLAAMLMVGRAFIAWVLSGQFQQAQKPLFSALALIVMFGVVDVYGRWTADTSPAGEKPLIASIFPDGYDFKGKKDQVSANDANVAVENLATLGNTIAHGIWGGISSGVSVLGGGSLVALFVVIALIIAVKVYVENDDLIKFITTLLTIAFLLTAVVGPPEKKWFPRTMLRLANEVMTPIASALTTSFDKYKARQEFHIISDAELITASQHARIYPRLRELGQIYVDGCRAYGVPVEQLQLVGVNPNGRTADAVRNRILLYKDTPTISLDEFRTGAGSGIDTSQPVQTIPTILLSLFDTAQAFAVYIQGNPKDFIQQYCTNAQGNAIFFAPIASAPESSNAEEREMWDTYSDRIIATNEFGIPISIGVIRLDEGTPINGASAIETRIREFYYGVKDGQGAIQTFLDQRQKEFDAQKAGRSQADSSQSAKADEKFRRQTEILKKWLRPPLVEPLMAKQNVKIGDAQSIGEFFRAGLEASSVGDLSRSDDHPLIGRSGPTLEAIMTNREFENPDAWGVILHGIKDGSVDRISKNLGSGVTDPNDPSTSYSESFLIPSIKNYIVPRTYQQVTTDAMPVAAYFATGPSREFSTPVSTASDVPEQSWLAWLVSSITGLLSSIASIGVYYIVRVVAEMIVPLAVAWGPFVVGVGIMFIVGFWPVIALVSLWPGRAMVILDWVKAVMWVMSWAPVIFLGRCLIESTGLFPHSYVFAVMQQFLGVGIILAAPVVTRIILHPDIGGLEGVAQWSTRTAIGVAGGLVGAGLAVGGGLASAAIAGAVGSTAAQKTAGETGAQGQPTTASPPPANQRAVGGGSNAPTGGSGGTNGSSPGGASPAGSSPGGQAGSNGGSRAVGTSPGGGSAEGGGGLATARAFLSGGAGAAVRQAGGQLIEKHLGGKASTPARAGVQAAATSLATQAVGGFAGAVERIAPRSPVAAGDRMAQAASAAWEGDVLGAKSQWQGFGNEMSNQDIRGGAAGGIAMANRALGGSERDLRTGAKGLSQAMQHRKSVGELRATRSLGNDLARDSRNSSRGGASTAVYGEAQALAAYGEGVAAASDDEIAEHADATPEERSTARERSGGARERMANHMNNARAAAARMPADSPERKQIEQLLAHIEQNISNRVAGAGLKG